MDAILRAELKCLRATWSTMTARLRPEDPLATPAKIAAQLLDRLIVDADGRSDLRAQLCDAASRSIPSIRSSLARAPEAAQPLAELELATKAGAGDEASFQRWCKALAALQSRLALVDDARVRAEVKALAAAEGGYSRGLLDASAAQERRSAQTAQPSASHIRNTREIDRAALLRFLQASFAQETSLRINRADFIPGGYSKFTIGIELAGNQTLPTHLVLRAAGQSGRLPSLRRHSLGCGPTRISTISRRAHWCTATMGSIIS